MNDDSVWLLWFSPFFPLWSMIRRCIHAFVVLCLCSPVLAQLRVQHTETVCYGLQRTVLRFSVPAGYFVARENPYVSIAPISQTSARVFNGSVFYGSLYPSAWRMERDSAAKERDKAEGRETYLVIVDGRMDRGKYRIVYSFSDGKRTQIDSTILNVTLAGVIYNTSKVAYFGTSIPINDWYYYKSFRSHYSDGAQLDSNIRYGFSLNNFAQGSEPPPIWSSHREGHYSPLLPQNATTASIRAIWRYPETGEGVVALTQNISIEQLPPSVDTRNARVENIHTVSETPAIKNPSRRDGERLARFDVAGVYVLVGDTPIGVQPQDPTKPLLADANCIRWGKHGLNWQLTFLGVSMVSKANVMTPDTAWRVSPKNVRLVEVHTQGTRATFTVELSNLPPTRMGERGVVTGTIALTSSARIVNPFNGIASKDAPFWINVPVYLRYPADNEKSASVRPPTALRSQQKAVVDDSEDLPQRTIPTIDKSSDAIVMTMSDWGLVQRLREEFTPGLKRSEALEQAEMRCQYANDIRSAIHERKPIPQDWIEKTENSADCETVKNFYIALATMPRIGGVAMLASIRNNKPDTLIGLLALQAPSRDKQGKVNPSFAGSLASPILTLSAQQLQNIPTQVFERDDSTGARVEVRGSMNIWDTTQKTLYDYCRPRLNESSSKRTTARILRTVEGKISGVSDLKEYSLETLGEEVVMIAADSSLTRRFSEVMTPGLPRTPSLDMAEKECQNTSFIKENILLGKTVPQRFIDEGGSPPDCETVKNYYTALQGLQRIRTVYILADKKAALRGIVKLCGVIGYSREEGVSSRAVVPNSCFSVEQLQRFKTKEFEKDDSTGTLIAVRGSIENSPFEYCAEYCRNYAELRLREGLGDRDHTGFAVRYEGQGAVRRVARVHAFSPHTPSQPSPRKTTRK